jgi:hypothetical protein
MARVASASAFDRELPVGGSRIATARIPGDAARAVAATNEVFGARGAFASQSARGASSARHPAGT